MSRSPARTLFLPGTLALAAAAALLLGCTGTGSDSGREPPASLTGEPSPTEAPRDTEVIAIAVNGDPTAVPAAVLYANTPDDASFVVPTGNWFLLVYGPVQGVRRSPSLVASDGVLPLDLADASEPVPGANERDLAEAMEALTDFFVAHQRVYLASMYALSEGYTLPLFDPAATMSPNDAETIRDLLSELDATVDDALAAIELLGAQPGVSVGARPAFGLFDWLQDRITDVVGGKDRAAKARDDILQAAEGMTAGQRQQTFDAIRAQTGLAADAPDAETFFLRLLDGEYDYQAAQIRKYLQDHEDFFHFFDKRNIETARDEGGALLVAGANFYADAIKEVLDKVFPGIGKGWELVEKLEERLQQMEDPSGFVVRSLITRYLDEYGYEYSDDEVDELVEGIAELVARVRSGGAPLVPATPTPYAEPDSGGGGEYGVFVDEYFGILVGRVGEVETTLVCSLRGGGLCEGENAEKVLGPVPMALGPFASQEEAVEAYCDNIVPDTYHVRPLGVGPAATMAFDGQAHAVDNAPACP